MSYGKKLASARAKVQSGETTVQLLQNEIDKVKYPQREIRELIQKYRFIKQALGSDDFPFLRYFEALEKAVPRNPDNGDRQVAISTLKQGVGAKWSLQGVARHWDDILKFESNMNNSVSVLKVASGGQEVNKSVTNFRGVRIFQVDQSEAGAAKFDMEFEFDGQ
jgi:Tfp pilus assembly protein PilN